ncbi:hypothetical protein L209DRAFT_740198 [Thermothelomyces heterothallicus CBS 203.75]
MSHLAGPACVLPLETCSHLHLAPHPTPALWIARCYPQRAAIGLSGDGAFGVGSTSGAFPAGVISVSGRAALADIDVIIKRCFWKLAKIGSLFTLQFDLDPSARDRDAVSNQAYEGPARSTRGQKDRAVDGLS